MKKTIITTAVVAFVSGVLVAMTAYFGYVVYQMNVKVDKNTKDIKAIVDFINESISKQNTTPVVLPPVTTITTSSTTTSTTTPAKK